MTNVDSDRVAIYLNHGGDSGGLEFWLWILLDEQGRRVARSSHMSLMGGGWVEGGPIEFGQRLPEEFDLRKYVAPPASGRYKLQVFRHNQFFLSRDEDDLTGLIVLKSEPLEITVTNPNQPGGWRPPAGFGFLLALLGAGGLLVAATRSRGRAFSQRDLVWVVLIALAAGAAFADCQYLNGCIAKLIPDARAEWSISVP
jgi:hypothetical protein